MTHFEYISVAVAIVLSLAVVRLLDALPHIGAAGRRYWVHAVWVGFLLLWSAVFWWLSWSHSARESEFAFPSFLALVIPPGLLYLCATALVSQTPASVASWREHFWAVRRRFFALALAFLLSLVSVSFFLQQVPAVHPIRAMQLVLLALFVSGLLSSSPRAQEVIAGIALLFAIAMLTLALVGVLRLDLRPGLPDARQGAAASAAGVPSPDPLGEEGQADAPHQSDASDPAPAVGSQGDPRESV